MAKNNDIAHRLSTKLNLRPHQADVVLRLAARSQEQAFRLGINQGIEIASRRQSPAQMKRLRETIARLWQAPLDYSPTVPNGPGRVQMLRSVSTLFSRTHWQLELFGLRFPEFFDGPVQRREGRPVQTSPVATTTVRGVPVDPPNAAGLG